ncbi:branched-chain amino acid transport system II carrier protein [Endozoicomonadaceae bacterium StTr2]
MKDRLSWQQMLAMGFMTFAMYLGAGNLIFPVLAGLEAGTELWITAAGFLVTGVGLPLTGIIAMARVGGGFSDISRDLPRAMITLMGCSIYLIIGPLYAIPRTCVVAYEIGLVPFTGNHDGAQLIYTLVFISLAWYLSLRPGKLMESIGEWMTPVLVLLLLILGITPLVVPPGPIPAPTAEYQSDTFIKGFVDGYMTMDTLASLLFGMVIITNLRSHGISSRQALTRYTIRAGVIAAIGMSLVYISLFYLGATSHVLIPTPENGGQVLSTFVDHTFGKGGILLLSGIVTLACLTTAIGLITAVAEYFESLKPAIPYKVYVTLISISSLMFANLGLNDLIELFIPVLLTFYPVSIVLIILALVRDWLPSPVVTSRLTLATVFVVGLVDGLQVALPGLQQSALLTPFSYLPGFGHHMGWIVPTLACTAITIAGALIVRLTLPLSPRI